MAELGCCDRVMRNLSVINQLVDLPDLKKINALMAKKDAVYANGLRSKTVVLKNIEHDLQAEMIRQQAEEKSQFTPNDTQYQRLVQKITHQMHKTQKSSVAPRNKQL